MAISIRRSSYIRHVPALCMLRHAIHNFCRLPSFNQIQNFSNSLDGTATNCLEFSKWQNGGGVIHKSVHIDPTALVEIGFGFFVDEQGSMVKKPQLLNARIGNHVEIGANTCIDRGSWRDTVIGDHSKIDNLVQIGHNVVIGKTCMLCGQVGIAGSVTIGDYVTLGGRVAVRDHVSIASRVRLAANSCVTKDIREPGDYGGFPAVPIREWRRQVAYCCWISKKKAL